MHAELKEKVARIVDPQAWETYDYVVAAPHGNEEPARRYTALSRSKADAIIATLRDALLSDEVVEAGARAMHVAASRLHLEIARAALTAALAKIGAPNVER